MPFYCRHPLPRTTKTAPPQQIDEFDRPSTNKQHYNGNYMAYQPPKRRASHEPADYSDYPPQAYIKQQLSQHRQEYGENLDDHKRPRRSSNRASVHDSQGSTRPIRSSRASSNTARQLSSAYSQTRDERRRKNDGNARSPVEDGLNIGKKRRGDHLQDDEHYRHKRRVSGRPLLYDEKHTQARSRRVSGQKSHGPRGLRHEWWRRKWLWILVILLVFVLIIAVAVGVTVSKRKSSSSTTTKSGLSGISQSSIPPSARGTYLDPFTWYDTTDLNVTYTDVRVGGLPIMGLNDSWNDNQQANPSVLPLTEKWNYGHTPIRGVNLGGWLEIEPFITPSFFSNYTASENIVDEWTLSTRLGPDGAASVIEKHYATFVTRQTFVDIRTAGFDHVRLCFSYWAVTTYPGDPYVPLISWRYLLRSIEWARQNGLRVNLDLHAAPGSQNGNNHSGRQGPIGWLNGTDGTMNGDRTLTIHTQLSAFFAQPRYANIITLYGILNEPRMVDLDVPTVLNWTSSAIEIIRRPGGMPKDTILVISDGFLALPAWQGVLSSYQPNLLLDAHQYVVFNAAQLNLNHTAKLDFACNGWAQQTSASMNPDSGFGTFLCGEWSQADTDCATYLNNVGAGTRWEGTLNTTFPATNVLRPTCPSQPCSCVDANTDSASYSPAYKKWLLMFAQAQMRSFEEGWGWFYWTWKVEDGASAATQWSYEAGLKAGIMPRSVAGSTSGSDTVCNGVLPDFAAFGLSESY